ncbi:MAG: dihydroorotate dehydrogenase B catalytic subunit [Candidatus Marinimicrobia bacterium]|nr:dihydroorotate dehydrogenase B catalytic subunit [Candidatus Neomarinimicrobiota bacterium]
MADLSIKIGHTTFKNPIFVASGTFGYGTENPELVDVSNIGAIVTKSITLNPREGNPPPRIVETPSGMINSIGLANIGVDKYINEMLPVYEEIGSPIIMNIAGSSMEEYIKVLQQMEAVSSNIVGYEINISCPNVKEGGMEFGVDCNMTEKLTKELRKLTDRLLIMKLSPNVTDISAIATSSENGGADAVSAVNTVVGMSIDHKTGKNNIYTTYGGLSGPAIKPVGLACVHKVYNSVKIPIIGIGGIVNSSDVIEYILAGSIAVQVGTANYRDPGISEKILNDLNSYLDEQELDSIDSLIGSVKTYD